MHCYNFLQQIDIVFHTLFYMEIQQFNYPMIVRHNIAKYSLNFKLLSLAWVYILWTLYTGFSILRLPSISILRMQLYRIIGQQKSNSSTMNNSWHYLLFFDQIYFGEWTKHKHEMEFWENWMIDKIKKNITSWKPHLLSLDAGGIVSISYNSQL